MDELNIYQKLIEVRKSVPYLQKGEKGYQFNFVSSAVALGSLKNSMNEQGLLLVPRVTGNTVEDHQTSKGGHEYFTRIEIEFTWVNADKPDETITCPWIGQGLDSGEKGVGKACTYAEKYFLLKFFNIPTDKDDPDSFQQRTATKEDLYPITADQVKELQAMLPAAEATEEGYSKYLKVANFQYILATNFQAAKAGLQGRINRIKQERDNDNS